MGESSRGGDVEEEYVGGVSYAYHTGFIRGDRAVVYGDVKLDCPITSPFIDIPYFERMIIVPNISPRNGVTYPMRALRVPSRAVYMHILLLICELSCDFMTSDFDVFEKLCPWIHPFSLPANT